MTNTEATRNSLTATGRYNIRHQQALSLLAKLTASLEARNTASANWTDVADIAHTVEHLAEAAAFAGLITDDEYEALEFGAR